MSRDDLDSLRRRAFSAADASDLELAISTFREALALCSNEEASTLLTNISLLYHQQEDWNKALLYAKQAMQAWPGNVKACFRAGMAELRLGQSAPACSSFSAGLQFVPGHRQLLSALAEAQWMLRQELRVEASPAASLIPQDLQEPTTEVGTRIESASAGGHSKESNEVARRLLNPCQQHQRSLRGKGWYECHQPDKPHTCHVEASLRVELQQILHITPGAALSDIRAAYRRMVLAAHPDKGGSVEAFERVQHTYSLLNAMTRST